MRKLELSPGVRTSYSHLFDDTTGTRTEEGGGSKKHSGLELKKLKVRLHDRTPSTITFAFVMNALTKEKSKLLGDAHSR